MVKIIVVNIYKVYTMCQALLLTIPALTHLILTAILERDMIVIPILQNGLGLNDLPNDSK